MIAQYEEAPHRRATAVVTIAAGVTSLRALSSACRVPTSTSRPSARRPPSSPWDGRR